MIKETKETSGNIQKVVFKGYTIYSDGNIDDPFGNPAYMMPNYKEGYRKVRFNAPDNKIYKVSRLVWTMFMGPIPKGMQIDHIDNDKTNDALSNLQLLTASQNSVKARANSRADYGTKTVIMVDKDGHTVAEFKSARQAERDTQDTIKAAHRRISECCHGLLALHRGFRWEFKYYKKDDA